MPTELVLLSDVEPATPVVLRAAASVVPDATFVDYRDGQIRQLLDGVGAPLLHLYRSRPVMASRQAGEAVATDPSSFGLWTDLTIPYGDPPAGRAVAEALAAAVGGVVVARA